MHLLIPFLAKDIDAERHDDAARHSISRAVAAGDRSRPAPIRRRLALVLAGVSRASAGAVRRLGTCLADDLAGRLASGR